MRDQLAENAAPLLFIKIIADAIDAELVMAEVL